MKVTGRLTDANLDFVSGFPKVTLAINEKNDFLQCYDELKKADRLSIEITPYRVKRSTDANSYFWVLCGKLAAKLQQRKVDVYRSLIREIGDNFEIFPLRNDAVDKFIANWETDENGRKRLGWICDIVGESKIEGYTNVCAYYGSSTYNSKQMSDLIDLLIFECRENGIPTETPEKIAQMKTAWADHKKQEGKT